ncbi:hypothetical protein MYAER_3684 [Microcystis aeruginosa NIES-2549]|uniref:Uncharacterized protein n=1 Tax=Microcystis aeruginosa NIES-2549 TaxID=1641812 RepID=A0A0F6RNB3_MICAE|nr:hypothetical protein MYAER_3684 [Microcystis aeruginosa NIES-2549]
MRQYPTAKNITRGGGSQGVFNHHFLLIFMFKIVLDYINIFDWLQGSTLECR